MITLFENFEDTQYVILNDNDYNINDNDDSNIPLVLVYSKLNNYNFKYVDEIKNTKIVLHSLEQAKSKIKNLKNMYGSNKFKYISIEELNKLIKDIEIKKDSKKYNI